MSRKTGNRRRGWMERALSLLLAAVLLAGAVPGATLPASADSWADEYLDKLVDWGVMRADQIGDPESSITRAEFVAIINRAYGYDQVGPIPFTDVSPSDWFYDDVAIAYNIGYMMGTSATTASPSDTLTREMAVCIMARNMMMKDTPAESLAFTDSRDISDWARGLVKTAVDNYVVNGYPDNSFGPQNPVTKGEMAALVTRCVGNQLNQPGDYTLGDVFDNVTITESGVTLRDTTVSGDLYVSAGVGLGDVKLENVKVLGRIIVSGTGESEKGDASVVVRNVTADEMLMDNMRDKLVTLRAEGLTRIGQTTVRTPAYIEDNTPDANGLRLITLQGTGAKLDLAGRIKEVVSNAPRGTIKVAKGTVQKLTVDENSIGSTVDLDRNTEIKELNLDVASNITGTGDIKQLNINASGATTSIMPENVYIRPGLTGSVGGENMDHAAAEEASTEPKLLSGYPIASDVAPTSLRADFAGNKRGTIYWGVSNIADGSISADELISKPSYGAKAVKNGSVAASTANTTVSTNVTGLTVGGSYYLSAVLVDARGKRSPVKVISFTTPDNSKPAFGKGYPYMSLVTDTLAQAVVMPTKSCKLYYAVLPSGASAPTANELRSASVSGNLGYGVLDVVKNTELTFTASTRLEELKDYVLYLWLCDADGVNSSNVQSLKFKTVDNTPPEYDPEPGGAEPAATSVKLTAGLNEPGTIYWAVVPRGKAYPLPNNQSSPLYKDNIMSGIYNDDGELTDANGGRPVSARLDSEYAKSQIKKGPNATKKGSVKVTKAGTDVTINVTGLAREGTYDLYYIAQDSAGIFAKTAGMITIQTLDTTPPVVYQYFSDVRGDKETEDPMSNSDVILRFNESINAGFSEDLLTLYRVANGQQTMAGLSASKAKSELRSALKDNFVLYWGNLEDGRIVPDGKPGDEAPWINYDNVVIQPSVTDETKIEVVFPGKSDKNRTQAISLTSGDWYGFQLTGIRDYSKNQTVPATMNPRSCKGTKHVLDYFNTVFADVALEAGDGTSEAPVWRGEKSGQEIDLNDKETGLARVDASFFMEPRSVKNSAANLRYEIALLSSEGVSYDLYYRIISDKTKKTPQIEPQGEKTRDAGTTYKLTAAAEKAKLPGGDAPDENGWIYLGNKKNSFTGDRSWDSGTVCTEIVGAQGAGTLPVLQELSEEFTYEFAVSVTEKELSTNHPDWNGKVNFRAYVLSSGANALWTFVHPGKLTVEGIGEWSRGISDSTGRSIGTCKTDDFVIFTASFLDTRVPVFQAGPKISAQPTSASVNVTLNRNATIYYVVFPRESRPTTYFTENKPKTNDDGTVTVTPGSEVFQTPTYANKLWELVDKQTKLPEATVGKLYDVTDGDQKQQVLQYYTIGEQPTARRLTDGDANYATYPHGIFNYASAGVPARIPIDKEHSKYELMPETDYYIYMVVEGGSAALSQVYVYNFRTANMPLPQISLRNDNGVVRASTQEGAPSTMYYSLINATALNRIPLLSPVEKTTGTDTEKGYNLLKTYLRTENGEKIALPNSYSNWTIIRAMMETYNGAASEGENTFPGSEWYGYSVFDVFADSSVKAAVADIIRGDGSGALIQRDTSTVGGTVMTSIDHRKEMAAETAAGTPYYCLAVAHHKLAKADENGKINDISFKAISRVMILDTAAPTLKTDSKGAGVSTAVHRSDPVLPSGTTPDQSYKFTGVVEISFNKPVYWVKDATTSLDEAVPVVQNSKTGNLGDTFSNVGILQDLGGTATTGKAVTGEDGTTTYTGSRLSCTGSGTDEVSSFTINFEDLVLGDTITLFNRGYIANSGGYSSYNKLRLTLTWGNPPSQSGTSAKQVYFAATWITG